MPKILDLAVQCRLPVPGSIHHRNTGNLTLGGNVLKSLFIAGILARTIAATVADSSQEACNNDNAVGEDVRYPLSSS